MDLSEIKQLKTDLRLDIAKLISEFEAATTVKVVDLEVTHVKMNYPEPDLIQVRVKTDI